MSGGDLLREAVRGVRLYRLRSILTALGFAIGTAAVVSLFAIAGGARAEILRRLETLGTDLVSIRAVGGAVRGAAPGLTLGDVDALRDGLGFVRALAPVREIEAGVMLPTERVSVRVVGTTATYFAVRRLGFERGRAFDERELREGRPVCVLGDETARRLSPTGDPYGTLVKIAGTWYRVIGILRSARFGGESTGDEGDATRHVYLPITNTFVADALPRQPLTEAWIAIGSGIDPEDAAPVIERSLERRHGGTRHFEVSTAARLIAEHRAARGLLDGLLLGVAVVSFALGGFGMTSASWQNVRARTREIAIRRAVGARRREILAQFLLEGCVLAAAGSLCGLFLGIVVSSTAASSAGFPWTLASWQPALAAAIAMTVGFVATLYPAAHAAALDPVAALRFEA